MSPPYLATPLIAYHWYPLVTYKHHNLSPHSLEHDSDYNYIIETTVLLEYASWDVSCRVAPSLIRIFVVVVVVVVVSSVPLIVWLVPFVYSPMVISLALSVLSSSWAPSVFWFVVLSSRSQLLFSELLVFQSNTTNSLPLIPACNLLTTQPLSS